jgi:hypothetical protein
MAAIPGWLHWGKGVSGFIRRFATAMCVAALVGGWAQSIGGDASAAAVESLSDRPSRLVFGNYCGYGRRYGDLSAPPVDRLDEICKAHDVCYISGRDRCECNADLIAALRAYRNLDAAARRSRGRAWLVSFAIHAMTPYCHAFPHGLFPGRHDHMLDTLRD